MGLLINIDNGGTFTDVCVMDGQNAVHAKTVTTPYDLTKCFLEVLKTGSKQLYGEESLNKLLAQTDFIRYSTTAGTNAMVQKKGSRLGLIIREGVDPLVLQMNDEEGQMFSVMVHDRFIGLNCDVSEGELEAKLIDAVNFLLSVGSNRLVVSLGGPNMIRDEILVRNIILQKYPRHLLGAVPVLFSHQLSDDPDDHRRTWSALINSFLHQGMERFLYNAENELRSYRTKNALLIFQNDGNSARVAKTTAIKTYGSGPRGGLEGAKALAKHYQIPALVTLDIGGTTSDIGVIKDYVIEDKTYGEIEGIQTSFPICDLISVGAGGSSIIKLVEGKTVVGPDSVGALPGPACFGRGGQEPTITDAYLLMGILDSHSYFGGKIPLDEARAKTTVEEKLAYPNKVSLESALLAMENAYEEKIARSLAPYQEQSEIILLAFGGAGPMSACGIAEEAGIKKVIIPRLASVFSAFGISFSDIAHEYQVSLTELNQAILAQRLSQLKERAERDMYAEGFDLKSCNMQTFLIYSRDGIEHKVSITLKDFDSELVDGAKDIRLLLKIIKPIEHFRFREQENESSHSVEPARHTRVLASTGSWEETPVYRFEDLSPGSRGYGPALIEDEYFTCRVLHAWSFYVNENRDIFLTYKEGTKR